MLTEENLVRKGVTHKIDASPFLVFFTLLHLVTIARHRDHLVRVVWVGHRRRNDGAATVGVEVKARARSGSVGVRAPNVASLASAAAASRCYGCSVMPS